MTESRQTEMGKKRATSLKRVCLGALAVVLTGPVVIKNLKYDGAPRNEGFILMADEVEAYRVGDKAFEFKGTNGFMITIDRTSKDVRN